MSDGTLNKAMGSVKVGSPGISASIRDQRNEDSNDAQVGNPGINAAIARYNPNDALVSSPGINVAIPRATPSANGIRFPDSIINYKEETDMIYQEVIFPECISYGSTGVPEYKTERIEVESGSEQRNSRQEYPRHKYNIVMENLPADETKTVMDIWHVCSGTAAGFMFLDPLDHTSNNSGDALAGTDITVEDQYCGTVVGTQTEFELFKYYTYGIRTKRRRIKYPKLETLMIGVDGVITYNWEYDYVGRKVRFVAPVGAKTVGGARVTNGVLDAASSVLNGLNVGDLIYITGFVAPNTALNAPLGGNPLRITSKVNRLFTLEKYNGSQWASSGLTLPASSIVVTQTTPPPGAQITAGYYFYVPVRFSEDDVVESEIKNGARETGIYDFNSITLTEVLD
jgi:uncharacterized protein (TIGR02217 family)